MLQRAAVLSVVICQQLGCSVLLSSEGDPAQDFEPGTDAASGDDAPVSASSTWGFPIASFLPLSGIYTVSQVSSDSGVLSTSEDSLTSSLVLANDAAGRLVAVIARDEIRVEAGFAIRASGNLPLVLLANRISIEGTVDVSSSTAMNRRGASGSALCGGQSGLSEAGGVGAGGGTVGGLGGSNPADAPAHSPRFLAGGCRGGHAAAGGVRGGDGGGAVQLIALESLELGVQAPAQLLAGGAGGRGGTANQMVGGAGGGVGGMIVLDSHEIAIGSVTAVANGGGGGSGSFFNPGMAGEDGATGASAGGSGLSAGGEGGSGGAHDVFPTAGEAAVPNGGGGGGGGSVGFVFVSSERFPINAPPGAWSPLPRAPPSHIGTN